MEIFWAQIGALAAFLGVGVVLFLDSGRWKKIFGILFIIAGTYCMWEARISFRDAKKKEERRTILSSILKEGGIICGKLDADRSEKNFKAYNHWVESTQKKLRENISEEAASLFKSKTFETTIGPSRGERGWEYRYRQLDYIETLCKE